MFYVVDDVCGAVCLRFCVLFGDKGRCTSDGVEALL